MSWFTRTAHGVTIAVHAQPGAKHSDIAGLHGERLKVRVAAPPVEGKANEALIEFIAERLGVPRSRVRVIRGEHSRMKLIDVADPAADPARLWPQREP